MKIIEEQVLSSLNKDLSGALDSGFELENIDYGLVERSQSKPMLLTALLGGTENEEFIETTTIKYDDLIEILQLPSDKAYSAYGPSLSKDNARQLLYAIGSTGLRYNVAPKDYANKRQPGSSELMTEEYVISQMVKKAAKAWDLRRELEFASVITADQNYSDNTGVSPVYNYFTDVYGTARGAKIDMDLGGTSDVFAKAGEVFDGLTEALDNANSGMSMAVVVCGKDFYSKRFAIEKQEGLARDIRGPLDLASMAVPRSNFGAGDGLFPQYQYFDSHDGFRYIRYSASILGTNLIGDEDAYVIPVGSDMLFKRVYAPAQDRENVNTTAQRMYTWSKVDNRTGVHVAQESNSLLINLNPKLIIPLTTQS